MVSALRHSGCASAESTCNFPRAAVFSGYPTHLIPMKTNNVLLIAASLSLAAFVLSLASVIPAIPALMVAFGAWTLLLTYDSYAEHPVRVARQVMPRAALPLAA